MFYITKVELINSFNKIISSKEIVSNTDYNLAFHTAEGIITGELVDSSENIGVLIHSLNALEKLDNFKDFSSEYIKLKDVLVLPNGIHNVSYTYNEYILFVDKVIGITTIPKDKNKIVKTVK